MDKVKKLVEAGSSIPGAVKECLGMSISAFADRYDLPRSATSEAINGQRRATERVVEALAQELGGSAADWRDLLQKARIEAAAA